jgi:Reverse transcriptase (RNA-dependent DNA polymerase)
LVIAQHWSYYLDKKKRSGEIRIVFDYKELNEMTIKNAVPIPKIDNVLDAFKGCTCYSNLDMLAAYTQIGLLPSDYAATAFSTPTGHYQWKVLSFGLTNAPGLFTRTLNNIMAPLIGKCCVVYLDDICIVSKNEEEHLKHLAAVLNLLHKQNKLYLGLKKCKFFL